MYTVKDTIASQAFDKIKVGKLAKTDVLEILSISLEKDAVFPEHTSTTDAHLIMLEGRVDFHINGKSFHLKEQEHFAFPKEVPHWVKASENPKFLIVR